MPMQKEMRPMSKPNEQSTQAVTAAAAANYAYNAYLENLPLELMQNEWDRFADMAGDSNRWAFPPIATADDNPTVKMSPDVLYSFLSYDVSDGPLHLRVPVSRDPFWSLTLFQANTDNYFGIDDREADDDTFELIILGPNQASPGVGGATAVASPTECGIAVVRIVVPDPSELRRLDRLRKKATATPMNAA
jgi:uncharacterized membrane protein